MGGLHTAVGLGLAFYLVSPLDLVRLRDLDGASGERVGDGERVTGTATAAHLPATHDLVTQSPLTRQPAPVLAQGGHATGGWPLKPPQSTSVSRPFFLPSLQVPVRACRPGESEKLPRQGPSEAGACYVAGRRPPPTWRTTHAVTLLPHTRIADIKSVGKRGGAVVGLQAQSLQHDGHVGFGKECALVGVVTLAGRTRAPSLPQHPPPGKRKFVLQR